MGSLRSGFALSFCEGGETPGGEDGVITGSEGSFDSLPLLANPPFHFSTSRFELLEASFLTAKSFSFTCRGFLEGGGEKCRLGR